MESRKAPTIQDVARSAGVSAATVSRALSSPHRVSEATRDRINIAVRETGYTLNQAARSLRMQRAKTILAAVPGIGNPYYSTLLEAVVLTANHRGYGVLVTSRLGDDPATWLADYLHSNRADGLLVFDGFLDTRRLHSIAGEGADLPLVAAYDELPDPQINSVLTDNLQAAERAVKHLYDLGHRQIGHISGPSRNNFPNERLVGFRKALFDHGLEVRDDWIVPGDYTGVTGVSAGHRFAEMKDRPTAIFAANDEMAIGFVSTIRRHGLDCPRDFSVVGFDDMPMAEHFSPNLTTMRQPREQIGQMATDALINIVERDGKADQPIRIVLNSELIVRDSTAPIGQRARAIG
jgi:LacI family repressor for deo operon, udp, cdd, tsx, nupC, and nupG